MQNRKSQLKQIVDELGDMAQCGQNHFHGRLNREFIPGPMSIPSSREVSARAAAQTCEEGSVAPSSAYSREVTPSCRRRIAPILEPDDVIPKDIGGGLFCDNYIVGGGTLVGSGDVQDGQNIIWIAMPTWALDRRRCRKRPIDFKGDPGETLGSLFAVQYFFPLKLFPTFLIFSATERRFWRHS
jgi:hypothetical protein